MALLITDSERELLSKAIVETLRSWPQLHRQIFSEAHYRGRSIESISNSFNMSSEAVRAILQECDGRLRNALKSFRNSRPGSLRPCYAVNGCFR